MIRRAVDTWVFPVLRLSKNDLHTGLQSPKHDDHEGVTFDWEQSKIWHDLVVVPRDSSLALLNRQGLEYTAYISQGEAIRINI